MHSCETTFSIKCNILFLTDDCKQQCLHETKSTVKSLFCFFIKQVYLAALLLIIWNIEHLEALSAKLEEREDKSIATEDLLQMAKFVLKNNFFEFDSKIKQQISGTAIGTKFAPPYACIFMDKFEADFLTTQNLKPWVWLRYIDDIFFV